MCIPLTTRAGEHNLTQINKLHFQLHIEVLITHYHSTAEYNMQWD